MKPRPTPQVKTYTLVQIVSNLLPKEMSGEAVRPKTPTVKASEYKNLEDAKFFVIKSYSEEDVYKV